MSYTYAGLYADVAFVLSGTSVKVAPGASVTVYLRGTLTKATLYSGRTKAGTVSNPLTVDGVGNLAFYADPGAYDVAYNGGTVPVDVQPDAADVPKKTALPLDARDYAGTDGDSLDMQALVDDMETKGVAARFPAGVNFRPTAGAVLDSTDYRFRYDFAGDNLGAGRITLPEGLGVGGQLLDVNSVATADFRPSAFVRFSNLNIVGTLSPNAVFARVNQRMVESHNVYFTGGRSLYKTLGYCDRWTLVGTYAESMYDATYPVVDKTDSGDGWVIDGFMAYASFGLRLVRCKGATVHGLVSGWHEFTESKVTFSGMHVEGDGTSSTSPLVRLRGGVYHLMGGALYTGPLRDAIAIDDDDGGGVNTSRKTRLVLGRSLSFPQRLDDPSTANALQGVALRLSANYNKQSELVLEEPRADLFYQTAASSRGVDYPVGIRVVADDSAVNTALSARPPMLTERVELKYRNAAWEVTPISHPNVRFTRQLTSPPNMSATAVAATAGVATTLTAATYYYTAAVRDREARATANLTEISATVDGSHPNILLAGNAYGDHVTLRVWRGTTTATYTHWTDIVLSDAVYSFYDQGTHLAGTAWSTTGVPSRPSTNDTKDGFRMIGSHGRASIWSAAAPTAGAWVVGDVCWNDTPSAAGTPGWVCVTAGTPGTWKAMAVVAS